ncbi:hypothetical protein HY772_05570 [Candidatus Woesearchaeota archaeon]|nr:hypothetical protein [Candidatus Woesearchaeota archaeon]
MPNFFQSTIASLRKALNLTSKATSTIQEDQQDWGTALAKITIADMLTDFKAAVDRYRTQGSGFNQFADDFKQVATRYGWQPKNGAAWRANVTTSTNLRSTYTAAQQQQRDPSRPGLEWVHGAARSPLVPRDHHLALDGKVFDGNDPFWSKFMLPSGYNCTCRWRSVPTPVEGYFELSDRLPYVLPDGRSVEIPAIRIEKELYPVADPGFYFGDGVKLEEVRSVVLQQMVQRQPQPLQQSILKSLPQRILKRFLG